MQEGLTKGWKKIDRRIGSFSGYIVTGIQFQAPDGETGWQISSWPFTDPVHDYWVDGDRFYRMRIDFDIGRTFEIFGEANVVPKEKDAIREAIRNWTSPGSGGQLNRPNLGFAAEGSTYVPDSSTLSASLRCARACGSEE